MATRPKRLLCGDDYRRVFAVNMKGARLRAGMTQLQVAAATESVNPQYISEIENEESKRSLTLRLMADVAMAVHAQLTDLLDPQAVGESRKIIAAEEKAKASERRNRLEEREKLAKRPRPRSSRKRKISD
jgi:transcriptional regulator with XRE-family HTH domain